MHEHDNTCSNIIIYYILWKIVLDALRIPRKISRFSLHPTWNDRGKARASAWAFPALSTAQTKWHPKQMQALHQMNRWKGCHESNNGRNATKLSQNVWDRLIFCQRNGLAPENFDSIEFFPDRQPEFHEQSYSTMDIASSAHLFPWAAIRSIISFDAKILCGLRGELCDTQINRRPKSDGMMDSATKREYICKINVNAVIFNFQSSLFDAYSSGWYLIHLRDA